MKILYTVTKTYGSDSPVEEINFMKSIARNEMSKVIYDAIHDKGICRVQAVEKTSIGVWSIDSEHWNDEFKITVLIQSEDLPNG